MRDVLVKLGMNFSGAPVDTFEELAALLASAMHHLYLWRAPTEWRAYASWTTTRRVSGSKTVTTTAATDSSSSVTRAIDVAHSAYAVSSAEAS